MGKGHPEKRAVITGAATGIGQAYARRLAEEGVDIAIADLSDASETLAMVESEGRRAIAYRCDLTKPEEIVELGRAVEADFGGCDILINNAGIYPNVPFEEISFEDWRRVMVLNLDSLFLTAKAFVPGMKAQRWGRIVNMSSTTFATPNTGYVHYVASKGGVVGFTRALATELAPFGVTVNAIAPSLVSTTGSRVTEPRPQERFEAVAADQPIVKVMEPEDLVGAMAFLTSDDAAMVTAQTYYVDGGRVRV